MRVSYKRFYDDPANLFSTDLSSNEYLPTIGDKLDLKRISAMYTGLYVVIDLIYDIVDKRITILCEPLEFTA